MNQVLLRQQLVAAFNDSELRDLCFNLGLDYEMLAGASKGDKVRELILHLARRGELAALLDQCRALRPRMDWPGVEGAAAQGGGGTPLDERESPLPHAGGDVIVAQVGAHASGVAVGKNIAQRIGASASPADDAKTIRAAFIEVMQALQTTRGQLDATTAAMAEFQLKLLQGELAKVDEAERPSASTITQVGDWLLAHAPPLTDALAALFATPAAQRVMHRAGPTAVDWAGRRFAR